MFKDAISVPGITLRFKSLEEGVNFALFSSKEKEQLHELMRKNITGGPSIIFHRDQVGHISGRTLIK